MKNKSIIQLLLIVFMTIQGILVSCEKKSDNTILPIEQNDLATEYKMDLAIGKMFTYQDSCVIAKMHSSKHLHSYDSIYHHHDSIYTHHHQKHHHGDTSHHYSIHHHAFLHHKHDSINTVHHNSIH